MLEWLILSLLIYGCYTDIKSLHVSNTISHSIALLALLNFSSELWQLKVGISVFFLLSCYFKVLGSADMKILIPIVFMCSGIELLFFIGIMAGLGTLIGLTKKEIPGYVPITIAFLLVLVI